MRSVRHEGWPFPALVPYHIKAYPVPQVLPDTHSRPPAEWPLRFDPSLRRYLDETRHLPCAGHQIYVHVPFCPFFCDYCPLYKSQLASDRGPAAREAYVRTLLQEIALYAKLPALRGITFNTIYIGGGTPTELTPAQLARILAALKRTFEISADVELTIEGVPRQFIADEYLARLVDATGVNRLSYGVQCLDPGVRRAIGRPDNAIDSATLAAYAREVKPSLHLNIDTMSGLPGQSPEILDRDLREMASWGLDSIDVLTYVAVPGTGLYRRILDRQRGTPAYGERLLEMRHTARAALEASGYHQVAGEVYQRGQTNRFLQTALGGAGNGMATVLGLGPSAFGQLDGTTYRNATNLVAWRDAIDRGHIPVEAATTLGYRRARRRAQVLGLILGEVPVTVVDSDASARAKFRRWLADGLLVRDGDSFRVTPEGRHWYNMMQLALLTFPDHMSMMRMLGSAAEQEKQQELDFGPEIKEFVRGEGAVAGTVKWVGYRSLLKAKQLPILDDRALGWNQEVDADGKISRQPAAHRTIGSIIPVDRDTISAEATLRAMRRYLARIDPIGGYVPSLMLLGDRSRLWTWFWFAARRVDEAIDTHGIATAHAAHSLLASGGKPPDYVEAIRAFAREGSRYLDSTRRAAELAATILVEEAARARAPLPANELFELFYHKAYVPTYVGMRLLLAEEPEHSVRKFARLLGPAMQLTDDLLDLTVDLERGALWLTREELDAMGIAVRDCRAHLDTITRLREGICIRYLRAALDAARAMTKPRNRRLAALFVETALVLHDRRRFRVYEAGDRSYETSVARLLPVVPIPDVVKSRMLVLGAEMLSRSPVRLVDLSRIDALAAKLPPCPPALEPEVALDVLERQELRYEGMVARDEWPEMVRVLFEHPPARTAVAQA